jgi:hypothetical protein
MPLRQHAPPPCAISGTQVDGAMPSSTHERRTFRQTPGHTIPRPTACDREAAGPGGIVRPARNRMLAMAAHWREVAEEFQAKNQTPAPADS